MKKTKLVSYLALFLIVIIIGSVLLACSPKTTTTPSTTQPSTTTSTTQPTSTTQTTTTQSTTTTTSTTTAATGPKYGGTLRLIANTGLGTTFGVPWRMQEAETEFATFFEETLVREDKNLNIQPWLATAWKIADDKSSITFTLRQGVKFTDGTDFNADAVKFNLDAQMKAKRAASTYWSSIDVLDPYTVRVNLLKWSANILGDFAVSPAMAGFMVSPTAIQKNGEDWALLNPVGTGPFKFTSYTRDVGFKGVKFADYWQKGKPYLDAIELLYIVDVQTAKATMMAGQADIFATNDLKSMSDLVAFGDTLVHNPDGNQVGYPDSGNADSPWANVKVRQAVEYAIDKAALVKALGYGIATVADQWPRVGTPFYVQGLARTYDPAKAQQLLAEAGYASGFKTTLSLRASTKDEVVAIQGYLTKVGITTDLETMTDQVYTNYRNTGWHNRTLWSMAASLGNFTRSIASYFFTPGYMVSFKLPQNIIDLYNKTLSTATLDPANMQALGKAMFDDATLIPIWAVGRGRIYNANSKIQDAGFFTQSYHMAWTPESLWMNK